MSDSTPKSAGGSTPKSRTGSTPKSSSKRQTSCWTQCAKCSTYIVGKDNDEHTKDCPPSCQTFTYGFVKDCVLHGSVSLKPNEEIKGLEPCNRDQLVFVSQSAMQLCGFSIGSWVQLKERNSTSAAIGRCIWPTSEKSLTSILFTRNGK